MSETTKPYNEIDDYIAAFSDEERQEYVATAVDLSTVCSLICRSAAVTVRRPRANTVPTSRITTFFQVGVVNSGSK